MSKKRLSKKQEADALTAYKTYFDSYIDGDVKTIVGLLEDDYNQIGSAEAEVFFNKKEAIHFLNHTISQVAGKAEMRHRTIKTEQLEGYILIVDQFDMYVLAEDEWSFYAKLRASTLMEKTAKGWKFVYQHSSMPDTRAMAGDNLAIEKISAENQQLREAVQRRTIELESKSRELEIEASLERVRAVAMGMQQQGDLLKICESLYKELVSLGFTKDELRNTQIIINNDDEKNYHGHQYSADLGGEYARVPYNIHPTVTYLRDQLKKSDDAFADIEVKGKKLASWKDLVNSFPQKHDKALNAATELHYYFHSTGIGALGISSYKTLPEDKLNILKRFSNVFNLSYQRYIDITLAEAQAKEAQIELGLERVRARAMAMQSTDELADLIVAVFQELQKLDMELTRGLLWIFNPEDKSATAWLTNVEDPNRADGYHVPFHNHPAYKSLLKGWQNRQEKWQYDLKGKIKDRWDDELVYGYFKSLPNKVKKVMKEPERVILYGSFNKYGVIQTAGLEALSDHNQEIFQRFSLVFEQTYTRFLDLQQAEAQAREAQIEAALERVRARTMAMQHSDELPEAANVLFQQVQSLGIPAWSAGYNIFAKDKKSSTALMSSEGVLQRPFQLPFTEHWSFKPWLKAIKKRESFLVQELAGEDIKDHYKYMLSLPGVADVIDDIEEAGFPLPTYQINHLSFFTHGFLLFITYEPVPDAHDIFKRFTQVFEQTYTRFLDLQKAEEQAREAEIELALERIRAKTMAMRQSHELMETSEVLFEQFKSLGANADQISIGIVDEEKRALQVSATFKGNKFEKMVESSIDEQLVIKKVYKAWKSKKKSATLEIVGKELQDYNNWRTKLGKAKFYTTGKGKSSRWIINMAFFSNGMLSYSGVEPAPADTLQLLERFAGVFDLTYTRFLDLQKAEAQAREAQIEASLERVRAASMAMHKSADLQSVISVVLEQIVKLDISVHATFIYDQMEDTKAIHFWVAATGQTYLEQTHIPRIKHPFFDNFYKAIKNGTSFYTLMLTKAEKDHMFRHYFKNSSHQNVPLERQDFIFSTPGAVSSNVLFDKTGLTVQRYTKDPFTDEENEVIKRIGFVFEQAYTRFLDLQKAEAQLREVQIEAALEKVRSRSLAMHESDELLDVIKLVSEQLAGLGLKYDFVSFGQNNPEHDFKFWMSIFGHPEPVQIDVPFKDHPVISRLIKAYKNNVSFLTDTFTLKESREWSKYLASYGDLSFLNKAARKLIQNSGFTRSSAILPNIQLFVGRYNSEPYVDNENNIIARFGQVFDQSYTRFLDLKKAEEQAREAQIEAALERVRAKSMAMHKTSELKQVIDVISQQFEILGITQDACMINIFDDKTNKDWNFWIATYPDLIHVPYFKNPITSELASARKDNKTFYTEALNRKDKDEFFEQFYKKAQGVNVPQKRKKVIKRAPGWTGSVTLSKYTSIHLVNYNSVVYTKEENKILKRIGNAFEQAYTRFLDLQKAEAQAREAQIEASLERVRSKAMAMHGTEGLTETVGQLFQELSLLDISLLRCGVGRIRKDTRVINLFTFSGEVKGAPVPIIGSAKLAGHPVLESAYQGWVKQKEYHAVLKGASLKKYYQVIEPDFKLPSKQVSPIQYGYFFYFSAGALYTYTENKFSEEELSIFRKFSSVVGLTYRRYLDLEEAEELAREARIEASLERVRAKAMAMHSSADLVDTANQLFKEFQRLEISFIRCGVLRIHEDKNSEVYSYGKNKDNEPVAIYGDLKLEGHEAFDAVFNSWQLQKEYYLEMNPEAVKRYYLIVNKNLHIPSPEREEKQFGYTFYFPEGCLYCFTNEKMNEETLQIMRRFNQVMGLTYRRYFELKEAEARELKAIKEASLDRVRAEIASMRTAKDLDRITPLVWSELKTLGVPFFRCGVFIINEDKQIVHAYLSTPDGKAVAALHIPINDKDNLLIIPAVKNWRLQKSYKADWDREKFIQQTRVFMDKGQIEDPKSYKIADSPPERLVLHLVPFKQGMLYAGSTEPLSAEHIDLMKDLAKAFSVAYARYEDFVELENAKTKVEGTLNELKSTQDQLVQSEKMASLGELTAGIAHEIQNPLNFVNNFSDVSSELIDEMNEELAAGNLEDAKEIATDLKQNLEKINNHGQRASGIVQGMLSHSRKGDGKKEPTDLNVLADEYLRLAYHGLRAKDKSFNADFKTDFEESLPKVDVISQDLGRVILNLINNAFYACTSASLSTSKKDYKPLVTVSTRKLKDIIEIRVIDNGSGIPDDIKDKIFEPFFTTKPTGSGTGLGLSMSYDIITKGHGGELKVESKEGVGTVFIIHLPLV
jgi:signal transduction histidine kinase